MKDIFEREEEEIERQLNDGEIDIKEYNKRMREIARDYRTAAEESAREKYDDEMERW